MIKVIFLRFWLKHRHGFLRFNMSDSFFLWFFKNISMKTFGQKIETHITDISDAKTFIEIFINKEYDADLGEPKKILDLGSNVGYSILFFKAKYPKATIHGYEPGVETFKKLERNVAGLENVFVYNNAISDREGTMTMFLGDNSVSSSFVDRFDNISSTEKVKCITWPQENFDLIKFDIEGAEHQVVKNPTNTKYIIGEVHHDLGQGMKLDNFDLKVEKLSAKREKVFGKIKNN